MRLNLLSNKIIFCLLVLLITACTNRQSDSDDDNDYENNSDVNNETSNCDIDDGTHSATVDYYNPKTGYSNTYTLDVEVEDCQVTTIYFDNGGYLDDSHIDAANINANGDASVEDDIGRSYDVHIDD